MTYCHRARGYTLVIEEVSLWQSKITASEDL